MSAGSFIIQAPNAQLATHSPASRAELRLRTCEATRYDPEAFGAKCQRCYLYQERHGGPVPPEVNPDAQFVVAAEAPGEVEVEHGRPLIGNNGQEIMAALAQHGVRRHDVTWTNAIACRPPFNELELLLTRLKKANKEREAQGLEPYLSPLEACRPRFLAELRHYRDVIVLGKRAWQALAQTNDSILDLRGLPQNGFLSPGSSFVTDTYALPPEEAHLALPLRVLPTLHPAFVMRKRRWRATFQVDIGKALRWFRGLFAWREPQRIYQPTPDALEYYLLRQKRPFLAYDVETGSPDPRFPEFGKEPLVAQLRCIGLGDPDSVMVVGFRSVHGHLPLYPSDQAQALREIIAYAWRDSRILKTGHNAGYYDDMVSEREFGAVPRPLIDTIIGHRGAESEMPHSLAYVGTVYTDVSTAWKGKHTAVDARSDEELWEYNGTDVVVQARSVIPVFSAAKSKGHMEPRNIPGLGRMSVLDLHHELQRVCVGLHKNGLYIDQDVRKKHALDLRHKAELHRQELRYIARDPNFNPNSRTQVAKILFEKFGLLPEVIYANAENSTKKIRKARTADGEPSTSDDVLLAALLYTQVEEQRAFLRALRKFRGAGKLLGTNILPLRPYDDLDPEPHDDIAIDVSTIEGAQLLGADDDALSALVEAEAERIHRRKKGKRYKPGQVLADGRVHPNWNAHTPSTQRLASSEPNAQNWSRLIRNIVRAMRGNLLFAADQDQLELKLAAGLAQAVRYLEAFDKGLDPHAMQAELLFGSAFKHGSAKDRKRIRDFTKRFQYLMLYKGTPQKAHEVLASVENDVGDLVYPDITLKEVRQKCDAWLKANPEFISWWDRDLDTYRRTGTLKEPFFGWSREFADGEDENEIANFRCQAGGAAVVHIATLRFLRTVPFQRWGPGTGLIQQGHDALMGEAPHDGKHETPHEVVSYWEDGKQKKMVVWCPEWPPEEKTKDGQVLFRRKSCGCAVSQAAHELEECMRVPGGPFGLPVTFTASAKVGRAWSDL